MKHPRKRKVYSIPNHKKTYVAVAGDSEATNSEVEVIYMDEGQRKPVQTVGDYRHQLIQQLFATMINNRLDEKRNEPNPPFAFAGANHGMYWSPKKKPIPSMQLPARMDV